MISDMLYTAQFAALRPWLHGLDDVHLAQPSALPGWSVRELIAHLIATGDSISALELLHSDGEPHNALGVAEYVSAYAGSAGRIAQMARDIAERAEGDARQALDESHDRAQLKLAELGAVDQVVQARRGPILLSNFLDTRILELVVHTRDLQHSLPDQPTPRILTSARNRVVIVLREIMTSRAADPVGALRAASLLGPEDFIDLTTGRMPAPAGLPEPLACVLPVL